ncbi:DNA sulfur modification protein DndB [Bacillus toyonensis]|uniref:DNA sulfur modification protein DndB n=1 Tax=Bacillus toyonensis TaxID=155322 RepID=UPI000BFDC10E|nr:DNA sulfur modification protein DndB [Bacillus toyonensis]PHG07242.1 DNA sulfur modification protein DndB [Bacillus toyonensis]
MSITNVNPINMGAPMATINLPALKYKSGNRIWYAITIPYRALGKFIQTSSTKKRNQESIKSEIRNRFLDPVHKNEIKNYILEEPQFTIPPVTLVSYDSLDFRPYTFQDENLEEQDNRFESVGSIAGVVILPIDYEFECLDGNHRTVAIRELANERPDAIADSNMLLNIVYENKPKKIRQDFVDVNKNAKQTSSSINTLFNTRDKTSGLVVDIIEELDYLNETTELLATSVSKSSKDIYTINNIKNVVIELADYNSQSTKAEKLSALFKENQQFENEVKHKALLFFTELKYNNFIEQCINDKDKTPEIRNNSLITSGTGIIVAARVAAFILKNSNSEDGQARNELQNLFRMDWSRTSEVFQGNVVGSGQKILNSRDAIASATEAVITKLGYTQEENKEQSSLEV